MSYLSKAYHRDNKLQVIFAIHPWMNEETKRVNFTIHDCPKDLIERVKAKASLVGQDKDEWVIRLLKRQTKKLIPLQQEFKKEEQDESIEN
jgi:hypothetical protein